VQHWRRSAASCVQSRQALCLLSVQLRSTTYSTVGSLKILLLAWGTAARMRQQVLAGMLVAWHCGQDELRRQAGATAFHQRFAASLSLLHEDARGALAELHLTVSSMLGQQQDITDSTAAVRHHASMPDSAGNAAAAAKGAEQSAEHALARAAACHGNLLLGRLRQSRAVQTAYCEMWSLAAGPWGRNDVRREVYNVMTGRAPPDSSLRALAAACHAASPPTGHSSSNDPMPEDLGGVFAPAHGIMDSDHGAAAAGTATAAAADFQLRNAPPAAATLRLVQTLYAAKAAADGAARTARKQPVPLYVLRSHSVTGACVTTSMMLLSGMDPMRMPFMCR
jgi:hypothetical protein